MAKTLVIINPHAASKRARIIWEKHEALFRERFGDLDAVITRTPADVPPALEAARQAGCGRVFSIGGDGTNNALINAIMRHNAAHPDAPPLAFGCIPAGTGRDWARGVGTPLKVKQSIEWLANVRLRPVDIGMLTYDDRSTYFLNVSSSGISNDVVQRVERSPKESCLAFPLAILSGLLWYKPEPVQIYCDGALWYEGTIYVTAVCNGKYFGQGLHIAPQARIDDGVFEIVIAEGMPMPSVLPLVARLYRGTHLTHPKVRSTSAQEVRVVSASGLPIGLDFDGEPGMARELTYRVLHHALPMYT